MSLEHAERLGLPLRGGEQVVGQLDEAIHAVHLLGDSIMGHGVMGVERKIKFSIGENLKSSQHW